VLERDPTLARAARHLSVYDQLRLSVEVLGGGLPGQVRRAMQPRATAVTRGCASQPASRHGRRRQAAGRRRR
jgi:hypothetical protein